MKTITIGIIVAMAIVSIAASPSPETTGIVSKSEKKVSQQKMYAGFSFFRIHRQGRGVTSTWGMSSETGISGYVVQRTYLDPSDPYGWENVCAVPCTGSRSYKWTDANVYAGFISYRIVAVPSGTTGEIISDVETIHITSH